MSRASAEFIPTRIAILTVSSRRGEEDDTSDTGCATRLRRRGMSSSIRRL